MQTVTPCEVSAACWQADFVMRGNRTVQIGEFTLRKNVFNSRNVKYKMSAETGQPTELGQTMPKVQAAKTTHECTPYRSLAEFTNSTDGRFPKPPGAIVADVSKAVAVPDRKFPTNGNSQDSERKIRLAPAASSKVAKVMFAANNRIINAPGEDPWHHTGVRSRHFHPIPKFRP